MDARTVAGLFLASLMELSIESSYDTRFSYRHFTNMF